MGCAVTCIQQTTMSLFGNNSDNNNDARAKLDRKLYIAKESPEPTFDLSECQLGQVPSGTFSICKVYRKEYLYLHDNNLHSLKDGGQITDLYLIKVLNISSNKFSNLPHDIRYLINLTELYVQDNLLTSIPDSIQHMQCLQILDLSNNKVTSLTPSLGKLKNLRKLNVSNNKYLYELCPELCFANNLIQIDLDGEQITFPPLETTALGTREIMKFLCEKMNVDYCPPLPADSDVLSVQMPTSIQNPFMKQNIISWEEQEAAIIEQENKMHKAAKQQREKFLSEVVQEQLVLDSEIAKVHQAREIERVRLIKAIQDDEKEIECLVKNFIQSDNLRPEVIMQQLAHEQAEHDRLLEITRQNYDHIKKTEVLNAMMAILIEEDSSNKFTRKHYEDSLINVKQNMLMEDLESVEKVAELLRAKDESRTGLVQQLLEDLNIQKAIVASLLERVDARSWSLNQEISLISTHLAKLSVIEQEKKKLKISYNYNELLHQRVQLVNLLDDLFDQQNKRRSQLIDTLRDMENETNKSHDFWLKNYQKLIDSAPKTLLDVGKCLDPVLANYLLQEGVIHCLPFLVKFLFSEQLLTDITMEELKANGVSLSVDREGIIRAINYYAGAKSKIVLDDAGTSLEPSAPTERIEESCTGVVNANTTEDSVLESECVICMDASCGVVFIPCGHMCCCQPCADKGMKDCPMCRTSIERTIKVIVA